MKSKDVLNETVINGSRVFVENGEVKVILNEDIQKTGFMSVEESMELTLSAIKKIYGIEDGVSNQ